jgi:hypothetical protein
MAAAVTPPVPVVVSIEEGRPAGVPATHLYEIVDYIGCLLESLEGLEDPAEREQCEADIARWMQAEVRKVDAVANYLQFCVVQQNFAANEAKRQQERKAMWERRETKLKAYVEAVMRGADKKKLEGRHNTLILRPCPPSVEVTDEAAVPEEYKRITVEETVDKTKAKEVLKAGGAIDGLRLVTDKKSVVLQ